MGVVEHDKRHKALRMRELDLDYILECNDCNKELHGAATAS